MEIRPQYGSRKDNPLTDVGRWGKQRNNGRREELAAATVFFLDLTLLPQQIVYVLPMSLAVINFKINMWHDF